MQLATILTRAVVAQKTDMMNRFLVLGLIPLTFSCSSPDMYDIVIQNIGFFDGHVDRGIVNIAINRDTIATITSETLNSDSLIDGSGKYLIPGLVNAHVHVSTIKQLQEGYSFGILTLLNMHTGFEDRELKWKLISKDSAGFSTLYGSGHAATVPGGHPNQFSPEWRLLMILYQLRIG